MQPTTSNTKFILTSTHKIFKNGKTDLHQFSSNRPATKPIADTKSALAGLFSLSVESVDDVNKIVENGLQAGGTEPHEMRDYGFMQQRSIEDPDGHTWEVFYMDMSKFPTEQPADK